MSSRRVIPLDPRPGSYVLILHATGSEEIEIGALGRLIVRPGYYAYVGSARGPGGLGARVARHCRKDKTLRWHIDYLRARLPIVEIWFSYGNVARESLWARCLTELPGAGIPLTGFGASDRKGATHLLFFHHKPLFNRFSRGLKVRAPTHGPILKSRTG